MGRKKYLRVAGVQITRDEEEMFPSGREEQVSHTPRCQGPNLMTRPQRSAVVT